MTIANRITPDKAEVAIATDETKREDFFRRLAKPLFLLVAGRRMHRRSWLLGLLCLWQGTLSVPEFAG